MKKYLLIVLLIKICFGHITGNINKKGYNIASLKVYNYGYKTN